MDKEININTLIGEIIDGKYKLEKILRTTSKSWVFEAREIGELSPERSVAIKILKPGQGLERESQFRKEVSRLAVLDTHKNIATLYNSGISNLSALRAENKTKFFYAAMELVPGKDLEQQIKDGRKFSLEEILNISQDVCDTSMYIKEKVGGHYDLKLKNIKFKHKKESENKIYVLDFGGRLRESEFSNDVLGVCSIFKELLKHRENPEEKIPNGLEKIVNEASKGNFETLQEFKNAIRNYCIGVSRRKFLKKFSVYSGGIVLFGGLGYYQIKDYNYRNSIGYIVDEIEKVDAADDKNIGPLFKELKFRIFNQKIRWLIEEEKIPKGEFPYGIEPNKSEWFLVDGTKWTSGFWPGILYLAYGTIKNEQFKNSAIKWSNAMEFSEYDEITINPIRFYYSHALGHDITKDQSLLEKVLQAFNLIKKRFNTRGNYLQHHGEINNSSTQEIQIDTLEGAISLLCWNYKKIKDNSIKNIIKSHCDAIISLNINEDGSIIQIIKFNSDNMNPLGGIKSSGYSENSCIAKGQARAIKGFAQVYEIFNDKRYLETAEKCAEYFINNLPEDKIPFYDFKDPNKDIPKDSSAAAIGISGLLDLFKITQKEKYKLTYNEILKSLSIKYLSGKKDYQGLLLHACANKNQNAYIDSSLIYADYYFLESLIKI